MITLPRAYVDYRPPKVACGKESYIYYYVKNPETGRFKRFKVKLNRYRTKAERKAASQAIMEDIMQKLSLGWNPILDKVAPQSFVCIEDAISAFINVKEKESEANTMRSYHSFVKTLRLKIEDAGIPSSMSAGSFGERHAIAVMSAIEDDPHISARTYNNYLAFYRTLWNWLMDRGYVQKNPFSEIRSKPKKGAKNRRVLSEQELSALFSYLEKVNPNYLAMCLLCYCCLMRPKEIVMLKCGDIDLERQIVKVSGQIAKNDCDSVRTIPDSMMKYISRLDLSNAENYIFGDDRDFRFPPGKQLACSRKIAKYWDVTIRPALGFGPELKFYSLKDTGITNMIDSGLPATFVQQQADHSSLEMTGIYLSKSMQRANKGIKEMDIINL